MLFADVCVCTFQPGNFTGWGSEGVKEGRARPGSELRSCVKVEVAVLGSSSLIGRMVSVDVKQH